MLTQERLKELLSYDPDTGIFVWRVRKANIRAGTIAGTYFIGYISIGIDKKRFLAHRLAFLYMNGSFPEKGFVVDHYDGNGSNNKFSNLRIVTYQINNQNKKSANKTKNRTSQFLGVAWHSRNKKWQAHITDKHGKIHYLGIFKEEEDARQAYIKAKRILHEGNTL